VSTHRPRPFPPDPPHHGEDCDTEKQPDIVAKSVLTGCIDHVDLTEHVALGVTVETRIYERSRRQKPARK